MSNQSGIAASQKLLDDFNAFAASSRSFLVVTINNEQLEVDPAVDASIGHMTSSPSSSSSSSSSSSKDFASQLKALHDALNDTKPAYVFARYPDSPDQFACISYVPTGARVREKMVYASTKNTVLRNLGSDRFEKVLFVDDKEDLSVAGWKQMTQPAEDVAVDSSKEDTWTGVSGTTNRHGLVTDSRKTLGFPMESSLSGKLDGQDRSNRLITMVIDGEKLVLGGEKTVTPNELIGSLGADSPSYNLYQHGGKSFLIYCCPSGSKVRDRMKYASSRLALTRELKTLGYSLKNAVEVGDPSELDVGSLIEEKKESEGKLGSLRIRRPRGPRRR